MTKHGFNLSAARQHSGAYAQVLKLETDCSSTMLKCEHKHDTYEQALACEFKENFVIREDFCCPSFEKLVGLGFVLMKNGESPIFTMRQQGAEKGGPPLDVNFYFTNCPWCGKEISKSCN